MFFQNIGIVVVMIAAGVGFGIIAILEILGVMCAWGIIRDGIASQPDKGGSYEVTRSVE